MNITNTLTTVAVVAGGVAIYSLGKLSGYDKGRKIGRVLGIIETHLEIAKLVVSEIDVEG